VLFGTRMTYLSQRRGGIGLECGSERVVGAQQIEQLVGHMRLQGCVPGISGIIACHLPLPMFDANT
jgi:hypothetical protein